MDFLRNNGNWNWTQCLGSSSGGKLAWNSFAWAGSNATTGNPLLPAEPIKVGIESFPGSVPFHGDFVWNDLDGNGLQDAGEPGIDGVTITLYEDNGDGISNPSNDTPYMTTISANGGQYLFSDFPLGNYFVEFSNLPTGFNPTHTNAGDDALDSLIQSTKSTHKELPGIILLDLNLPGTDGLEVLHEIKSNEKLKHIPTIILTTSVNIKDVNNCYYEGANSYVQKPIELTDFFTAIKNIKSYK